MTNNEINKYIAVEIMGVACWHDWENLASILMFKCRKCGECWSVGFNPNPQYTNDAFPRVLLNEVVAKLKGNGTGFWATLSVFSTAEQIARASVEAHKASGNPANESTIAKTTR